MQRLQNGNGIKIKWTKEFFFLVELKHSCQQNEFGTKLVGKNMRRCNNYTAALN